MRILYPHRALITAMCKHMKQSYIFPSHQYNARDNISMKGGQGRKGLYLLNQSTSFLKISGMLPQYSSPSDSLLLHHPPHVLGSSCFFYKQLFWTWTALCINNQQEPSLPLWRDFFSEHLIFSHTGGKRHMNLDVLCCMLVQGSRPHAVCLQSLNKLFWKKLNLFSLVCMLL